MQWKVPNKIVGVLRMIQNNLNCVSRKKDISAEYFTWNFFPNRVLKDLFSSRVNKSTGSEVNIWKHIKHVLSAYTT